MVFRMRWVLVGVGVGVLLSGGCGDSSPLSDPTQYLNPSFVNYSTGEVFPLAPGAASGFVLVRTVNRTQDLDIEFVVTSERQIVEFVVDAEGEITSEEVITTSTETVFLQTYSGGLANEVGILLDCPVSRVGLGEDLRYPFDEPGLFVGTTGEDLAQGFGVPGRVNPLDLAASNYACGDTIVFEVIYQAGAVGGVKVNTFVLSAADQPSDFSGRHTFNNARALVDRYADEE